MKYILSIAFILLLSTVSYSQKFKPTTENNRFKNDNNYKKFLGKPRYKLNSNQSVSLGLDNIFTFKSLNVGYQRKFGKIMADVQGNVGLGNASSLGLPFLPNMFKGALSGFGVPAIDTAKQKFGGQLGLYRTGNYAAMSGFLIGVTAKFDQIGINYRVNDPVTFTYKYMTNTITKFGLYGTVGMRVMVLKNVGAYFMGGMGFRNASTRATSLSTDFYNNAQKSGLGRFGNIGLFYSF